MILVAIVVAGCKDKSPPKVTRGTPTAHTCSPEVARDGCAGNHDPFLCGWSKLLDDRPEAIAGVLEGDGALEEKLRAAFPALAGKTLEDGVAPEVEAPVFRFKSFPEYRVELPVDWHADPNGNKTWRMELQSLAWVVKLKPDVAAAIVRDFAERALTMEPALEFTWDDAGASKRLTAVQTFFAKYLKTHDVLDRRVVLAVARIVLAHLYSLATPSCYAERDNHGMMENVAVLSNVRGVPNLVDGDAIWDAILARTVEHVHAQVGDDGVHLEHSPAYHSQYLSLLITVIGAIEDTGATPPAALLDARDGMLASAAYLIQPNGTFPQFGDTENGDVITFLAKQLALARAQTQRPGSARAFDTLEWVLSAGTRGTMPTELDAVFPDGGYATFRERWDTFDGRAVTAAVTCAPLLRSSHYHPDEGSFEIYGYGTELVVDSGKYTYDRKDPFTAYQYSNRAHNVLVVDDAGYDNSTKARFSDSGKDWVECRPAVYPGIDHTRRFEYRRPSTFVVTDTIESSSPHAYAQHLHLAPGLDHVEVTDDHTVVATPSAGGPSLTITASPAPASIDTVRGRKVGLVQGWYFTDWGHALEATDVIFDYAGTDLTATLTIEITPPN